MLASMDKIPNFEAMPPDLAIFEGDLCKINGAVHVRVMGEWIEFQKAMNMTFHVQREA